MNLPNYLTLIRIFLAPIVFICLAYYDESHSALRGFATIFFIIAILTDALDGIIARRFHLKTHLGTFLDPFADKLLLISGFFAVLLADGLMIKPPLWIIIIVVFRDLLIVFGLAIIFISTKHVRIQPNILGKTTTTFQMLTILAILFQWRHSAWVWNPMAILTILSGIVYSVRESRRLTQANHTQETFPKI